MLEQVALRRGASFAPVETELDGHRVIALEAEAVVLPARDDEGLYADVGDGALARHPRAADPLLRVGQPRSRRDVGLAPAGLVTR